jgi:hypothetical protein
VLERKEIYDYMFLRPTGKEAGLSGWWAFNEGQGLSSLIKIEG